MKRPVARLPSLWSLLLVVTLGSVYLLTLLPGLPPTGDLLPDVGEFQFIGQVLGISHWTGYPTYIVLNALFVRLFPFGELAFRANLLSAVFAVGAAYFCAGCLRQLGVRPSLAWVGALVFGLSHTLWSQALIAEVYALHALFFTLVSYFVLRYSEHRLERDLLLAVGFYALSFGNHLTTLFLLPAFAFLVFRSNPRILWKPRLVLLVLLLILLGAAQYLYVFWRSADPTTPFVFVEVRTFSTFMAYISGGEYQEVMFDFTFQQMLRERLPLLWGLLWRDFSWLLVFVPIGIAGLKRLRVHLYLLLYFVFNALFALNYDIGDIELYFLPNGFVLSLYIGLGLETLTRVLQKPLPRFPPLLFLAAPLLLLSLHYQSVDLSGASQTARLRDFLATMGDGSALLSGSWSESTWFWYLLLTEQQAQDSFVVHHHHPQAVYNYVYHDQPLYLSEQRRTLAPGYRLYHDCRSGVGQQLIQADLLSFRIAGDVCRAVPLFGSVRQDFLAEPAPGTSLVFESPEGQSLLLDLALAEPLMQALELNLNGETLRIAAGATQARLPFQAQVGTNRLTLPPEPLPFTRLRLAEAYLNLPLSGTNLDFMRDGEAGFFPVGFGQIEGTPETPLRWGFGPQSRLLFTLEEAQNLSLYYGFFNPVAEQQLELSLNGRPLATQGALAEGGHEGQVLLEAVAGLNELVLHYGRWNRPEDNFIPADGRPLALYFSTLRLSPAEPSVP